MHCNAMVPWPCVFLEKYSREYPPSCCYSYILTYICTWFAVHISASCLDAQSGAFSCRVDEFLKPQSCLYFNGHKLATNKKGKNPAYFHCVVLLTSPHGGLEATEVVHGWLNKWKEHSKLHKIKREGLDFINESKTQHLIAHSNFMFCCLSLKPGISHTLFLPEAYTPSILL